MRAMVPRFYLLYGRGRRHCRSAGVYHPSAGDQCRRATGAIRARHRHVDRPAAGRTDDRAAPARRRHSENSNRGSFVIARAAARHRGRRKNHAAGKRPDRRRGGCLFSGHQSLRAFAIQRRHPAAVQRRQRGVVARRGRHASVVRRRIARRAGRRRTRRLLAERRQLSADGADGVSRRSRISLSRFVS